MIIPVRCVTCGKVISDKWRAYQVMTGDRADDAPDNVKRKPNKKPANASAVETAGAASRKQAMDELGLVRYCCRRHFLSHVELIERI